MKSNVLQQRARQLRNNMTEVEKILWSQLRCKRLGELRFRRQVYIGKYIVDFACFDPKIIIEVDGSQHQEQLEQDHNRTSYLESLGYVVLRFWNFEITDSLDGVLETIINTVL